MSDRILLVVGPTASGKTPLSLLLAGMLNGEIISADSRQIYRHLDIGTAKPAPEALQLVRHHFIDILDPKENYNAGHYSKDARLAISDILSRKKVPIVAGGSGLYIEALIDGFFEGPSADPEFRERYLERLNNEGAESLLKELRDIDPESAAKMHSSNTRRIIRALEVYHATGKPISEHHKNNHPISIPSYCIAPEWKREVLYERINTRVDAMLEAGLVAEVEKLIAMGYARELNALQTVGYKEVFQYLNQEIAYDEMVELIKRNSRRYAKRQLTWFRPDSRIHWINLEPETDLMSIAEKICAEFTAGGG